MIQTYNDREIELERKKEKEKKIEVYISNFISKIGMQQSNHRILNYIRTMYKFCDNIKLLVYIGMIGSAYKLS